MIRMCATNSVSCGTTSHIEDEIYMLAPMFQLGKIATFWVMALIQVFFEQSPHSPD